MAISTRQFWWAIFISLAIQINVQAYNNREECEMNCTSVHMQCEIHVIKYSKMSFYVCHTLWWFWVAILGPIMLLFLLAAFFVRRYIIKLQTEDVQPSGPLYQEEKKSCKSASNNLSFSAKFVSRH